MTDNQASPERSQQVSDSWKTAGIRAAEERFDEAIRSAERRVAETKRFMDLNRSTAEPNGEIERMFKEHARSPDAPEAVRKLYRRIAAGEFTWDDLFAGRAGAEELRAAAEPHLSALDDIRNRLQAGETLEDLPVGGVTAERDGVERRWAASPYDRYTREGRPRPE